ncbi:amino acid permease-associated region [Gluconacetobacter diazotrophicus PA1 5]|uniref:APC family permease n=1 Tax=Gluconacetobacter diazotrophicus TaxID=33996 RepID=UPI000173AFDD|nr:APC family permease [Gluconacetobacter diazotrophicus]ACI50596.1 amino acid permease-associated region [Gluconacetobacter diazotrophicus PA1 5]TWB09428.1 amino acid/polyamine/organocation transporter (APC superfamily) [Gluconacetobacter diazotrophicus]
MSPHLNRALGPWQLMFTGLSAMIGSGWLFGAQRAAATAGPAASLAWLLGAVIALAIAGVATELGGMFPVAGGMVRYANLTHGPLVGFMAASANWLSIVSVVPVEAEASVQYMSSWSFPWARGLYHDGVLTPPGLMAAAVLVVVYFLLNFWSVRFFARFNAMITVFKLVVPAATALALMASSFRAGNLVGDGAGGFMPYGLSGILTAVSTSGIVFAFNGFQSPLNLAGEARNPARSIPFAVLGSVVLATVIYLLLQCAYLGAVRPGAGGWAGLSFSSPFAQLAIAFNLNWLAMLLYFDAFLAPSGAGATHLASSTRMTLGMQRNGTMPDLLGRIHPLYGVPRPALWFNLGVAFIFLFCFRGWGILASVISVCTVISYMMLPIAALALRRTLPDRLRPVRVPAMRVVGALAFMFSSLLLYWARWPLSGDIILLMLMFLPLYAWFRRHEGWARHRAAFRHAVWFMAYLPTIAALSYGGSTAFGGRGWIPYGWDLAVVAVVSLLFCEWGVRSAVPVPDVSVMDAQDDVPSMEGH